MNVLERIRYSRNCTNDTFPLPIIIDCLWYAYTESGEAIDARLRMAQPEHLRNNHRNVDMRKEVGQVIYMLGSAWVQMHRTNIFALWPVGNGEPALDFALTEACERTVQAVATVLCGDKSAAVIVLAMQAWCHVCALSGWDVDALIEETCADFERKHCVVREVL